MTNADKLKFPYKERRPPNEGDSVAFSMKKFFLMREETIYFLEMCLCFIS